MDARLRKGILFVFSLLACVALGASFALDLFAESVIWFIVLLIILPALFIGFINKL